MSDPDRSSRRDQSVSVKRVTTAQTMPKTDIICQSFCVTSQFESSTANANNESHPIRGGVGRILGEQVCLLEQCDCSLSCSNRIVQWHEEREMQNNQVIWWQMLSQSHNGIPTFFSGDIVKFGMWLNPYYWYYQLQPVLFCYDTSKGLL